MTSIAISSEKLGFLGQAALAPARNLLPANANSAPIDGAKTIYAAAIEASVTDAKSSADLSIAIDAPKVATEVMTSALHAPIITDTTPILSAPRAESAVQVHDVHLQVDQVLAMTAKPSIAQQTITLSHELSSLTASPHRLVAKVEAADTPEQGPLTSLNTTLTLLTAPAAFVNTDAGSAAAASVAAASAWQMPMPMPVKLATNTGSNNYSSDIVSVTDQVKPANSDVAAPVVSADSTTAAATGFSATLNQALPEALTAVSASPQFAITQNALTDPAWADHVSQRVLWMVEGGIHSASLTINPPDLGAIQVQVSINQNHASVHFQALHMNTIVLLENMMPRLTAALNTQGIQLDDTHVAQINMSNGSSHPSQFNQSSTGQNSSSGQQRSTSSAMLSFSNVSANSSSPAVASVISTRLPTGVDYYA